MRAINPESLWQQEYKEVADVINFLSVSMKEALQLGKLYCRKNNMYYLNIV